jgi:hypothetical protein
LFMNWPPDHPQNQSRSFRTVQQYTRRIPQPVVTPVYTYSQPRYIAYFGTFEDVMQITNVPSSYFTHMSM